MKQQSSFYVLILLIGLLLATVGCTASGSTDATATSTAPDAGVSVEDGAASTPEAAETDDTAAGTPEATAVDDTESAVTPEIAETEEVALPPVDLDNPLNSNSPNNAHYIAPRSLSLSNSAHTEDAPAGYRWLLAEVTLGNNSESTISVDADDLHLIGSDAVRYDPAPMQERIRPALVGYELPPESSVVGYALFALPDDVSPQLVEWCVNDCTNQPLQISISLQD